MKIYLVRHATPDWSRTDIRYDVPPGPPLTAHGEAEARKLGDYLHNVGVQKIYASPLERTQRTAHLAAERLGLPVITEELIAEWRKGENETDVAGRFSGFWERICVESEQLGPIALVTHGGPIKVMLLNLGMPRATVDEYCRKFDRGNPVPPAGVWLAANESCETPWHVELVFTPTDGALTPAPTPAANGVHAVQAQTVYV